MHIAPIKLRPLIPPKDDLFSALLDSSFRPGNGDIVAFTSKVISIDEGRCLPVGSANKDELAKREASLYVERKHSPHSHALHTLHHGVLIRSAGIDESNGSGHFILWPEDPMASARRLRAKIMKRYGLSKLGTVITDSTSTPLRRGAIGFALAWSGFRPLYDYRGARDLFGRRFKMEQANLADALAASAVLVMGEGKEQTPVAIVSDAPATVWHPRRTGKGWNEFLVPTKEDIFATFFAKAPWRKGGGRR